MKLNSIAKILAIAYTLLITLFVFDSQSFLEVLIHLIPTIIFAGCLILAWYKPKYGAITFAIAGIGTIIVFNTYREFIPFVAISLIPMITGVLFWFSKK
jgi:hypothetical protein